METKQIVNGLLDRADRIADQSAGRIMKQAAKRLRKLDEKQRWIPVTERLPDTQEYDWVLAQIAFLPSCCYGVPVVAEWRADGWYDTYDNLIDGNYEKVTHWMPLPEAPKEVER